MVSKQQKEMQKKKARERDSRKKVLAIRGQIRARAKEDRMERQRDRRIAKLQREIDAQGVLDNASDDVLSQLEHNVKILKALETEHEEEQKTRQKLNDGLEEQGKATLNDKLKVLREKLFQPDQVGVGGSANYRMMAAQPQPQPRRYKEVSDVEIVKAPVADVEVVKAPTEVQENS